MPCIKYEKRSHGELVNLLSAKDRLLGAKDEQIKRLERRLANAEEERHTLEAQVARYITELEASARPPSHTWDHSDRQSSPVDAAGSSSDAPSHAADNATTVDQWLNAGLTGSSELAPMQASSSSHGSGFPFSQCSIARDMQAQALATVVPAVHATVCKGSLAAIDVASIPESQDKDLQALVRMEQREDEENGNDRFNAETFPDDSVNADLSQSQSGVWKQLVEMNAGRGTSSMEQYCDVPSGDAAQHEDEQFPKIAFTSENYVQFGSAWVNSNSYDMKEQHSIALLCRLERLYHARPWPDNKFELKLQCQVKSEDLFFLKLGGYVWVNDEHVTWRTKKVEYTLSHLYPSVKQEFLAKDSVIKNLQVWPANVGSVERLFEVDPVAAQKLCVFIRQVRIGRLAGAPWLAGAQDLNQFIGSEANVSLAVRPKFGATQGCVTVGCRDEPDAWAVLHAFGEKAKLWQPPGHTAHGNYEEDTMAMWNTVSTACLFWPESTSVKDLLYGDPDLGEQLCVFMYSIEAGMTPVGLGHKIETSVGITLPVLPWTDPSPKGRPQYATVGCANEHDARALIDVFWEQPHYARLWRRW